MSGSLPLPSVAYILFLQLGDRTQADCDRLVQNSNFEILKLPEIKSILRYFKQEENAKNISLSGSKAEVLKCLKDHIKFRESFSTTEIPLPEAIAPPPPVARSLPPARQVVTAPAPQTTVTSVPKTRDELEFMGLSTFHPDAQDVYKELRLTGKTFFKFLFH